ncbi:unnamed protein product [Caenorhabditis nigoni]
MESKDTVFQLHCQLEKLGEKIVNSFHEVPKKGHPAEDSVSEMVHCGLGEENTEEAQKMIIDWVHYLKNQ